MEKKHIIMLVIAILIVIIPFFLYSDKGDFSGSDDNGRLAIEETGYKPWFSSMGAK